MPALLTEAEKELLVRNPGKEHLMLQTWSLHLLHENLSELSYKDQQSAVLQLRKHCAFIVNMLGQPIPFPYYHSLLMIMCKPSRRHGPNHMPWEHARASTAERRPLPACARRQLLDVRVHLPYDRFLPHTVRNVPHRCGDDWRARAERMPRQPVR